VVMNRSLHLIGSMLFAFSLSAAGPHSGPADCKTTASLNVQCSRSSSLLQIQLGNCKKIGKVVLEIRDQEGRTLYREEGKALTGELVRRLDKGVFPRGTHTLTVTARDFAVAQVFTIE
jgi:hypothetical protein